MRAKDKILVLADGSERTLMTAEHLKEYMPDKMTRKIVLFHVASSIPEELRDLENDPSCTILLEKLKLQADESQKKVLETLEQAKRNLIEIGGLPEELVEIKIQHMRHGIARDIIEEARKGYVAVVLRRRGLGPLQNIILGSVAVKLLQSLTFIPVILVGPAPAVKRVLLAVDASPNSMRAVDFIAATLGGHDDYEVCVFHGVVGLGAIDFDPVADAQRAPRPCEEQEDDCLDAYKRNVGKLVLNVRDRLVKGGVNPDKLSVKVTCGATSRAGAIVSAAEDGGFGTIVIGRRGLSRVDSFFMGRVSHAVVYEGKQFSVWVV